MIRLPKGVELETRAVVLSQEEDTCGRLGHSYQILHLKTENTGGGEYLVIEAERWAIDADEIDAFATMLKDFIGK